MAIDLISVPNILDFNAELKLQGFRLYPIDTKKNVVRFYNRIEFYKIFVITGHNKIQYADKSFYVNGTTLFFGSPRIPNSWENITEQTGDTCLIKKQNLSNGIRK